MSWVSVSCPQCSAPLPRIAIWRSVKCPACGSLIVRNEALVRRQSFRDAFGRAVQAAGVASADIRCGAQGYRLMESLGIGEVSHVYLAQRLGVLPFLATVKISSASGASALYSREAQVLRELQGLDPGGAGPYFSQFLPQVVAQGVVEDHAGKHALVLRHPNGYWGSLSALNERFPRGIDSRHAVWIWRRMLSVLGFIHSQGWAHNDVRPEHALVHPGDHGVRLIGWGNAQARAGVREQARDLLRSARVLLVLLNGHRGDEALPGTVPAELANLISHACEDERFCASQRAEGLDAALRSAARAAFGPPSFVHLTV